MDVLMIFAWVVLVIMIAGGVAVALFLGGWPGRVARQRNHPYQEAVAIGGWVTLIAGFVFWPLVLIWAHMTPGAEGASQ